MVMSKLLQSINKSPIFNKTAGEMTFVVMVNEVKFSFNFNVKLSYNPAVLCVFNLFQLLLCAAEHQHCASSDSLSHERQTKTD